VPIIDPRGVYTLAQARLTLGLRRSSLSREIRLGRLKVAKRCGKYFIKGAWLIEWLDDGELVIGGPGSAGEGSTYRSGARAEAGSPPGRRKVTRGSGRAREARRPELVASTGD
jgi:hypothetical protein